ncbi:3D domain-containing protein [Zunongwangia sp. H14]|uniref:3D domain-containing protein n=1 Tax=Zunongwangia sp. H14 TaxID=3240792 RepID=UPI00356A5817
MKKLKNCLKIYYLRLLAISAGVFMLNGFYACNSKENRQPEVNWDTLQVTVSAYNSLHNQAEGDPNITAWGDTLKPGTKAIAVSRDLIKKGLNYNTRVKIEGFEGEFLVKDKMHYRWKNKIDIYMGENVKKARKFGRKRLEIAYVVENDSLLEADEER